jgi:Leucine-rich repeat (LRR) protein
LKAYYSTGTIDCYSLKGVTGLDCSYNKLTELPELPKELRKLYCACNNLISLPNLPKSLSVLSCTSNHLSSLPILPNSLECLYCSNNQLNFLPKLPKLMTALYCALNQLELLPELPNGLLKFYCDCNPLVFIPPLSFRPPARYVVPKHLEDLHSPENYSEYRKRYQTYIYLITFLTLRFNLLPTVLLNNHFWFPGNTTS